MDKHQFEFEKIGRLPFNEFSEIATCDQPSMDFAYTSYILDFPEAFKKMFKKDECSITMNKDEK